MCEVMEKYMAETREEERILSLCEHARMISRKLNMSFTDALDFLEVTDPNLRSEAIAYNTEHTEAVL